MARTETAKTTIQAAQVGTLRQRIELLAEAIKGVDRWALVVDRPVWLTDEDFDEFCDAFKAEPSRAPGAGYGKAVTVIGGVQVTVFSESMAWQAKRAPAVGY